MIKLEFKTRGKIITRYEVFSNEPDSHYAMVVTGHWTTASIEETSCTKASDQDTFISTTITYISNEYFYK